MIRIKSGFPFALWLMLLLAACGGGGGGGGSQIAGIERLGVSVGTVSGFGSIVVNGEHIGTNNADFLIDDSPGSQSDLEVGDVVIVSFDPDAANLSAKTVYANEAVEGPIDSIDPLASRIVVAGQTVNIDADTSFDDTIPTASLAGLNVGDRIEVSGLFVDSTGGTIEATRIEPQNPQAANLVEVHGAVGNLDTGAKTFMIGALLVDYGAVPAVIDNAFPGGVFADGDFVEVKGDSFGGGGALLATKIEPDAPGVGADDRINTGKVDEIEIEGFITRFVDAGDFDVADQPVTTNAQTSFVFEDGTAASAADLALNVKVEAEGSVDGAGVLVASKIEVRRASAVRLTGQVDSVDAANNLVTVFGVSVRVDTGTRVEDKSNLKVEPFSLADVSAGDYLEIRGVDDGANPGGVLATRLEREDLPTPPNSEAELQGFVDAGSIANPSFSILGVTVMTDNSTVFRRADGTQFADANAFFAQLQAGDLVKADGDENPNDTLQAVEVEMEN